MGMVVGFGKIQDEMSYKYHEYDGIVGIVISVFRLAMYIWFLWAVQSTGGEGGHRLKGFLNQFRFIGTLYFAAFPAMWMFVKPWAPYLQHRVMVVGMLACQFGTNVWLMLLFLTRGEYFKVSTLSTSFLPGATSGK